MDDNSSESFCCETNMQTGVTNLDYNNYMDHFEVDHVYDREMFGLDNLTLVKSNNIYGEVFGLGDLSDEHDEPFTDHNNCENVFNFDNIYDNDDNDTVINFKIDKKNLKVINRPIIIDEEPNDHNFNCNSSSDITSSSNCSFISNDTNEFIHYPTSHSSSSFQEDNDEKEKSPKNTLRCSILIEKIVDEKNILYSQLFPSPVEDVILDKPQRPPTIPLDPVILKLLRPIANELKQNKHLDIEGLKSKGISDLKSRNRMRLDNYTTKRILEIEDSSSTNEILKQWRENDGIRLVSCIKTEMPSENCDNCLEEE